MRKPAILCLLLILLPLAAGCSSMEALRDAEVDFMFRQTEATAGDVLELTTPALVSKVNGAYEIEGIGLRERAALTAAGDVEAGQNLVFVLTFTDLGDISVLRTDDKRVSLRAELGPEGKVLNALLGSTTGRVTDGFTSALNDEFESGTWEILYDGPELVVGRIDLKFRKYRVSGNFRAPRLR